MNPGLSLRAHFDALPDPRVERTKRHELLDIVTIAVCAVLGAADTWVDVERWGNAKLPWLRTWLELPAGIPSHDTFGRVFAALDSVAFERCFLTWVQALATPTDGEPHQGEPHQGEPHQGEPHQGEPHQGEDHQTERPEDCHVVAIDGKTVRRRHQRAAGQAPLHLVSAWATANQLVLGQVAVADKSNELTAIPTLLDVLALEGATVTIDAMGCQPKIAHHIRAQRADYVLALKDNQPILHELVAHHFAIVTSDDAAGLTPATHTTIEKDHGRLEVRRCWATDAPEVLAWLDPTHAWPALGSIACVEGERRIGGVITRERRYYLSSLPAAPARLAAAIRGHWEIENRLHWVLDVAFREDECRVRVGHAAENFAVLRHIALNLLRRETTTKVGVKAKRLLCAWDNAYLLKVLLS